MEADNIPEIFVMIIRIGSLWAVNLSLDMANMDQEYQPVHQCSVIGFLVDAVMHVSSNLQPRLKIAAGIPLFHLGTICGG
jgi:hypothetical protein